MRIVENAGRQRFDFLFLAFFVFFGIIFLTAFLAFLAIDLAAPTTRFTVDFVFLDLLATVFSLAFGFV